MTHLFTHPLPALAESAQQRYATFMALYFAQGCRPGVELCHSGRAGDTRQTLAQITAYSAMALLPWRLKLVVAPLMERFTYRPMGRRPGAATGTALLRGVRSQWP